MPNEILLFISVIFLYGSVLLWHRLFGLWGLLAFSVFATVAANIEVMLLVDAFGIEQTLGNVMFATTFLITDIISECYGKKEANRAVNIGIATSLTFILVSQLWLLYTPNANDFAAPAIHTIFSNTPRVMLASLIVYAIVQRLDVWLFHRWWRFTERRFGDRQRFLWLRNNASTLISQLLNAVLYSVAAFWGTYSSASVLNIILSSYLIFIFTSLADTPIVYLARRQHERKTAGA